MVKPLSFKGDKKPKKRKRAAVSGPDADASADGNRGESSKAVRRTATEGDDGVVAATAAAAEDDDSWVSAEAVSDVAGPVMIVLPTDKAAALACDGAGKVFAMPVENIVDGNVASAEPHDVRMVWVANKVSGTEMFRFKGHHGRYLASSKIGQLSATSEAVSPLESFAVIPVPDVPGAFALQTSHETFLSAKETPDNSGKTETRADADAISFATTLRVRMQARFKPRVRSAKEEKALARISRKELEEAAGRRLDDDEVRRLKRARREGDYHERLLEIKVKGKHDKFG